jgi:hypothetical protein
MLRVSFQVLLPTWLDAEQRQTVNTAKAVFCPEKMVAEALIGQVHPDCAMLESDPVN